MRFIATPLPGVMVIKPERNADERGFFARTWCVNEFEQRGLETRLVQCNISFNRCKGTVRGLHYQIAPHAEAKLIRCTRGSIYDIALDLRPDSPTFKKWFSITLTARNRLAMYIPIGLAHGLQTQTDNTEILYQMSEFYYPEYARGVRWTDPAFDIRWPLPISVISDRDQNFPDCGL